MVRENYQGTDQDFGKEAVTDLVAALSPPAVILIASLVLYVYRVHKKIAQTDLARENKKTNVGEGKMAITDLAESMYHVKER